MDILEALEQRTLSTRATQRSIDAANEDLAHGRLSKPALKRQSVAAYVGDAKKGRVRVRIDVDEQGVTAHCECGGAGARPCRHAVALELLLVGDGQRREEDEVAGATLEETERRRREQRAASELFEVERLLGGAVYARYAVRSPSSERYEVAIRALDAPHNDCTCPDFATNRLGTCKHIEAVLRRLRMSAKSFREALSAGPCRGYLFVGYAETPLIGLRLPPSASRAERKRLGAYFPHEGLPGAGVPVESLAVRWAEAERACLADGVEVPGQVLSAVQRVRDEAERERRTHTRTTEVLRAGATPAGFRGKLYPYQLEGVAFLVSRGRALLADDMGLGKTAQAIAATLRLLREKTIERALIVCPASLKHQWANELGRFSDLPELRVCVVSGRAAERHAAYREHADLYIVSYEQVRTDEPQVRALAPELLILDEAQRIKNWRTRTATAVKRIPSRFAFVLTGTPLENRLDDLYSLLQVVDPHLLGPLWCFNRDFVQADDRGLPIGYHHLDELRRRLRPIMLRRRKEEVLHDLPELVVSRLYVPLGPEQRQHHDDAEAVTARLFAILKRRPLTPIEEKRLLSSLQKLRMSCNAAGLVDKETVGSPKLTELASLLDELCVQGGHKVVIFSEWERMQEMAAQVCAGLGIGHVRLHGGVPSQKRGGLVERFTTDPACKVFFSTDAGGTGLNLQVATYLINLDLPWNPAVLRQRLARIHRIGQRQSANAILMIGEDSFEQRMEGTLGAKHALFSAAVGDDSESTSIERTSLVRRLATILGDAFAAPTGAAAPALVSSPDAEESQALLPAAAAPIDPTLAVIEGLRAQLGEALERVVRGRDGRLLAVVHGETPPTIDGVALLPQQAADALQRLGETSPLAGAETLYQASRDQGTNAEKRVRTEAAVRKLGAARLLAQSGAAAEALGLCRDAMSVTLAALVEPSELGTDPAAWLAAIYGTLVPTGLITAAHASAFSRAGELARAFATSALAPPPSLVAAVLEDTESLLTHIRGA